jgi:hypothetical protein
VRGTCAGLLALAAILGLASGTNAADDASYRVGYSEASNDDYVRAAMTGPGVTSASLCDTLLERVLVAADANGLVQQDFVSGCKHAVADLME